MIKPAAVGLAALFCLASAGAFAEACYVTVDSALAGPTGAREETCFEHHGAEAGSLDWSCQSEKDVQGASREKRDSCPTGFFGKCTAELTQEALANERSAGQKTEQPFEAPQMENQAQQITYHYRALDGGQAKLDCENAGGKWQEQSPE